MVQQRLASAPQQQALAKASVSGGAKVVAAAPSYRVARNYSQQSRVINGRAFYQSGSTWTDSTAQARKDLKPQQIAFGTDAYFALLRAHPEAAPWLSLSNEVDVVIGNTLYQVR